MSIDNFSKIDDGLIQGNLSYEGSGASFVTAFRDRIQHILEANGAFFNGSEKKGSDRKRTKTILF